MMQLRGLDSLRQKCKLTRVHLIPQNIRLLQEENVVFVMKTPTPMEGDIVQDLRFHEMNRGESENLTWMIFLPEGVVDLKRRRPPNHLIVLYAR
jgi:hypothetical protein